MLELFCIVPQGRKYLSVSGYHIPSPFSFYDLKKPDVELAIGHVVARTY